MEGRLVALDGRPNQSIRLLPASSTVAEGLRAGFEADADLGQVQA
jgi:hypothetical protein